MRNGAKEFSCSITVSAAATDAYQKISRVADWWATNVKGNTQNLNDRFTVRFGKTFSDIRVIEAIPAQKLTWLITDCDLPLFANPKDWLDTKIMWELNNSNERTTIKMTHVGLTPDKSCFKDCEKGWTFYVTNSLFKLIEENAGLPGTGIFSYLIVKDKKYEGLLYFKNDPLPDYPEGFLYLDVKSTNGEQVTDVYSYNNFCKESFDPSSIKGEYIMILAGESGFNF